MGIELFKNGLKKLETGFVASSKEWQEGTRYREQIVLDDDAVTRYKNLIIIDMSGWAHNPAAADWTNYVRVYEHVDATEVGVEINSQTIDQSWAGGNHDAVCFLNTQTDTKTAFTIYYGDIDLGAPGYTSDLTVTADAPAANDYTVEQDSYYKIELDYSQGGSLMNLWTRVSGGNVQIGLPNNTRIVNMYIDKNATVYSSMNDDTPTITEVEGGVGANAGAVLVAFKVSGVPDTAAGAGGVHLQDDSAVDVTFENIYIFCDCQLFMVISRLIMVNDTSTMRKLYFRGGRFVNGYFSHQSYQYGATQAEEVTQDRDLSANWATKKYMCYYDITSNDGFVLHFIEETLQNIETQNLKMDEGAGQEEFYIRPDNSGTNTVYSAGTEEIIRYYQVDDFTADLAADETTAKNKDLELQTALTQSITESVMF